MAVVNEWNPSTNILFTFDASSGAVVLDLSGGGATSSFTIKNATTQGSGVAIFTLNQDGSISLGNGRNLTAASAGNATTISAGGATSAGTNLAGGNLTLQSGISTGTGRSFVFIAKPVPGATGTTDNTQVNTIVCGSIAITNAGTNILTIPLAALQSANGFLIWGVTATDGTDVQAFAGISTIALANKAASLTSTVTELAGIQAKAATGASTITEAVSVSLASSVVTVKYTPTTSLTTTTFRLDYVYISLSGQSVTAL